MSHDLPSPDLPSPDLPSALAAIADGATGAHTGRHPDGVGGLDLAAVRAAAGRRRTRFLAGVSATAAALVVGVALAGAAAGGWLDRAAPPPAGSASPTPDDVWATGGCGMPVTTPGNAPWSGTVTDGADEVDPSRGADVAVRVVPATSDIVSGQPASATITTTYGADVADGLGHWTLLVLVRDGVVVGVPDGTWDLSPEPGPSASGSTRVQSERAELAFTGCTTDRRPGAPLAGGDLELVALVGGVSLVDGTPLVRPAASAGVAVRVLLAAVPYEGPALECGAPLLAPGPADAVLHVAVDAAPGARTGQAQRLDAVEGAVSVRATVLNDVGRVPLTLGAGDVRLVVVRVDGVVAGDGAPEARADGTPIPAGGALSEAFEVRPRCGALDSASSRPLGRGDYSLWVVVDRDSTGQVPLVAGPWPLTVVGELGWTDVATTALPDGVPIALSDGDRVLRSQAFQDGRRWRVTVSYAGDGPGAYARARDALVATGFAVAREQDSAASGAAGGHAVLTRGDLTVTLDVSNETGEGFYADYDVVRAG